MIAGSPLLRTYDLIRIRPPALVPSSIVAPDTVSTIFCEEKVFVLAAKTKSVVFELIARRVDNGIDHESCRIEGAKREVAPEAGKRGSVVCCDIR